MITLTSGDKSIVIRSPNLGDTRVKDLGLNIGTAMSGKKWTYAKPLPNETLTFNFQNLDRSKVNEILDFKEAVIGKTVTLHNYDGTVWIGELLTDPISGTHSSRASNDVSLVFEGKRNA